MIKNQNGILSKEKINPLECVIHEPVIFFTGVEQVIKKFPYNCLSPDAEPVKNWGPQWGPPASKIVTLKINYQAQWYVTWNELKVV